MSAIRLTAVVIVAGLSACQAPPSRSGEAAIEAPRGFSWVIEGELAAMARPGASRDLEEDLAFLAQDGVSLLISLTITPVDPDAVEAAGLERWHIPVADFTRPTLEQMDEFVELVAERTALGEKVTVHCTGGLGRSGTMSAANFVANGLAPDDAIREIRRLRPGSIETADQELSVFDFADHRASRR